MDRRFTLFLVLSVLVVLLNMWITAKFSPPKKQVAKPPVAKPKEEGGKAEAEKGPVPEKPSPEKAAPKLEAAPQAAPKKPAPAAPRPAVPERWLSLGSVDPQSPYRMAVTFTNRGAAVARIELSDPRYRDEDDRSGYLGHLTTRRAAEKQSPGVLAQVVVAGTPAQKAGVRVGDVIEQIDDQRLSSPPDLENYLSGKRPGQAVTLRVRREGRAVDLPAVELTRRPLDVAEPEGADPLSFLLTLYQVDDRKLPGIEKTVGDRAAMLRDPEKPAGADLIDASGELKGIDLRQGIWEIDQVGENRVVFRRTLDDLGLQITKTYSLVPVPEESRRDPNFKAYHLAFDVAIQNVGNQPHRVAYQLDGPTGLPTEGYWYASKVGRSTWGAVGLRDVVVSFNGGTPEMTPCPAIDDGKFVHWEGQPLSYIGVDAQYFSSVMIPQSQGNAANWIAQSQPLKVQQSDTIIKKQTDHKWQVLKLSEWKQLTNTSCRLVSEEQVLKPKGQLAHHYVFFAGPKRPDLLTQYGLGELVYYGWFGWAAKPMVQTLHFFYAVVRNYGMAIILLTVLVRLCMFPLSRKQALSTVKMQQLQPEIRKIQEKYKTNVEARTKAQQELFRKHNYNPLGGCLLVFIQLPIFVALYRSLMVDVELRQAPLVSETIRWCSNLAAPDMLLDWSSWMPNIVTSGQGIFGLGPYFNLLPIFTIILFLWQQKKMLPPPADEQAAMQQKIMQYMMIFMGILFFKVASGLCIYFIASSLWGMGERKFLPKFSHAEGGDAATPPAPPRPPREPPPSSRRRSRGR